MVEKERGFVEKERGFAKTERGFAKTEISLAERGELFPRWVGNQRFGRERKRLGREGKNWLRGERCGRDLAKREAILQRAERFYLDTQRGKDLAKKGEIQLREVDIWRTEEEIWPGGKEIWQRAERFSLEW